MQKLSFKNPEPQEGIHWIVLLFIGIYHILLLVALPLYLWYYSPSGLLIGLSVALGALSLLAITMGYHRLYSHKTFKTKKVVEIPLLFFGTLAVEGSVLQWAFEHRLHHKHVDTDDDPYNAEKGFWHSHILWMFRYRKPIDARFIPDLVKNDLLVFQDKYYSWLIAFTNISMIILVGILTGDWFGAVIISFLLRMFVVHHCTWFINSLAHMWGTQPYSTEHSAVNNFILSFLTFGEGYHNYHHTFAGDYRNGIHWYHFDPPKVFIWLMEKVGLASDIKRVDPLMIKRKLVQADRQLLEEHLQSLNDAWAHSFLPSIESMSEKINGTILSMKRLMDQYRSLDKKVQKGERKTVRQHMKEQQLALKEDLRTWQRLCHLVLDLAP